MSLPSFRDALDAAAGQGSGKLHVLLGNGFSRALRNDIFSYTSLFSRADFSKIGPQVRRAFSALGTTDFERVMRGLEDAARLTEVYSERESSIIEKMNTDAVRLREVLVTAIAENHPALPSDIRPESYEACARFLGSFNTVYTLNYDILLYWTIMACPAEVAIPRDDGFRSPSDPDDEFVEWDPSHTHTQNVHYLHGALHLFDAGDRLLKCTWKRTGVPLIDQVRGALGRGAYPHFVSEGSSRQKVERIRHSDFLSRSRRSFANVGGTLVVFGHSFSEGDEHVLTEIVGSQVTQLVIGLHGDPAADWNDAIRARAEGLVEQRGRGRRLATSYFDAATARVWG